MKNKIVFITGSTSGIGEACAQKFASQGARLILNGRDSQKLMTLVDRLKADFGADCIALPFDVRNREHATEAIQTLATEWKEIDLLINNAGLVIGVEKEYEGDLEEWDTVLDTNIKGLLTMTRLIVPSMVARNRGHIINIGSIAGEYAYPGGSVYCATKAAVKMLSDGLRIDLVDTPLRVTNVRPGYVETNFSVTRFRGDQKKADQIYKGLQPLTGLDVAEVVYFAAASPAHVQLADILMMPTAQATATISHRQ